MPRTKTWYFGDQAAFRSWESRSESTPEFLDGLAVLGADSSTVFMQRDRPRVADYREILTGRVRVPLLHVRGRDPFSSEPLLLPADDAGLVLTTGDLHTLIGEQSGRLVDFAVSHGTPATGTIYLLLVYNYHNGIHSMGYGLIYSCRELLPDFSGTEVEYSSWSNLDQASMVKFSKPPARNPPYTGPRPSRYERPPVI